MLPVLFTPLDRNLSNGVNPDDKDIFPFNLHSLDLGEYRGSAGVGDAGYLAFHLRGCSNKHP